MLNDENNDLHSNEIEKMKKEIKGKRCALDQDNKVVTDLVKLLNKDDDYDEMKHVKVDDFKFCDVKKEDHVKKDNANLISCA